MSIFGFSSKKEVEEKERLAREEARRQAMGDLAERDKRTKQNVLQGQQTDLHGMLVYGVDDIAHFNSVNKTQNVNDGMFQQKLKGQVTKYVKGVVTNAPMDNQIPVLQLERKILEISELVQQYVTPKIESLFGINVRSIDITT